MRSAISHSNHFFCTKQVSSTSLSTYFLTLKAQPYPQSLLIRLIFLKNILYIMRCTTAIALATVALSHSASAYLAINNWLVLSPDFLKNITNMFEKVWCWCLLLGKLCLQRLWPQPYWCLRHCRRNSIQDPPRYGRNLQRLSPLFHWSPPSSQLTTIPLVPPRILRYLLEILQDQCRSWCSPIRIHHRQRSTLVGSFRSRWRRSWISRYPIRKR